MDADQIQAVKAEILAEMPAVDMQDDPALVDAHAVVTVDPVESLAGLVQVVSIAAGYAGYTKAAAIWTPETCRELAAKTVPVLVKYSWGQRFLDFLATGSGVEELALLATAAPLALSTWSAVKDDGKPTPPPAAAA